MRLRQFLDVITEQVAIQHPEPLRWKNRSMNAEQWNDLNAITTEVLRERLRNEDPERSLIPGASALGVVRGFLGDATKPMISSRWDAGGDGEWQFHAAVDFNTSDDGTVNRAKPLNQYPVEWLASLVTATGACVEATGPYIDTMGIYKALNKVHPEAAETIGAVHLLPHGIGEASLPGGLTVLPCDSGVYPDGVVVTADLDKAVNEPEAIVDDLLAVYDLLNPDQK